MSGNVKKNSGHKSRADKATPHNLTEKQKKLVEAALDPDCKTLTEMANRAGYHDPATAQRSLKSPSVKIALTEVQDALIKRGFNPAKIANMICKGLDAEVVSHAQFEGQYTDSVSDVDFRERREHLKIALELFKLTNGHLKNAPEQHLHLHFKDKTDEQLANDILAQVSFLRRGEPGKTSGDSTQS